MHTTAIEKLLRSFGDEALTRLGMDAMECKVPYGSRSQCLLGHHQDGYIHCFVHQPSAMEAELEYRNLFDKIELYRWTDEQWQKRGAVNYELGADIQRNRNLLPLIDAEWNRRKLERQQAEAATKPVEEKVEELVCV